MYLCIKRVIDVVICLFAFIVLLPVLIIISVLIKIESKGPVLFKQRRIGKNKREFLMLKFRTMRIDTPKDVPTHLLKNPDQYITKMGNVLRLTSMDELPQLLNIIKGDMSIVGPRPALYNQYDLIKLRDNGRANQIRPGLTGLAQISGRDELPIEIKARFDCQYAQNITFIKDTEIFFKTIKRVIKADGVLVK